MKTFSDSASDLLLQTKAILLFPSQYIDECCHQDTKFTSWYTMEARSLVSSLSNHNYNIV